ncbi:MAG: ABC transporter ATP-binding protein [Actinomycetota bacterium]
MTPPEETVDSSEGIEVTEIEVLLASRAQPRSFRELPQLIRSSFGLVWRSSPRRFAALVVLQLGGALLSAVLVYLGTLTLQAVQKADKTGASLSKALPPLLGIIVVSAIAEASAAVLSQQLRLLGEIVQRATWERVLVTTESLDLEEFEDPTFFDRVQRVRTNALLRPFELVTGLISFAGGLAGAIALTVALFALQPVLVPVLLLAGVPLWWASRRGGRLEFDFSLAQTPTIRARDYLADVLTGRDSAKEVRAYALGPVFRQRWGVHYGSFISDLHTQVRRRTRLALIGTSTTAIVVSATTGILIWLVTSGRANLADAGGAAIAIRLLASRLQQTVSGAARLFECKLFLRDLHAYLDLRPAGRQDGAPPPAVFPGIRTESLHFRYPGTDNDVLTDVDIEINPGEVVALVGANGSGKTTLAKLLAQLYRPTSGRVLWGAAPADQLDRAALRRQLAVVFQDFARYQLPVRDNIGVGDPTHIDDDERAREAARNAGADRFISSLPLGYDTMLSRQYKGGRDLSLGQWQRIALARAFHRDAQLLILDEPTASLDARAEHDLFERIRTLFAGRSVLLIAHRFSSVRPADRIYVLDAGRVIEQGSHDELMAVGGVYAELFTLQAAAYLDTK